MGATKEKSLRVQVWGSCSSLLTKCWNFFPPKGHNPGYRREKKLKWIINNKKSNLGILESDLHSAHNDDSFTAVIGLIT